MSPLNRHNNKLLSGDKVRIWRLTRKITQQALADKLGVTRKMIQLYEKRGMSQTQALALSAIDHDLEPWAPTAKDWRAIHTLTTLAGSPHATQSIDELCLSAHVRQVLHKRSITTVGQLTAVADQIELLPGVGVQTADRIRAELLRVVRDADAASASTARAEIRETMEHSIAESAARFTNDASG